MLGTSTCCQLRDFLPSRRKGLLQHIGVNEVSVKRDWTVFCLTATQYDTCFCSASQSITKLQKTRFIATHLAHPSTFFFFSFNNITTEPNPDLEMGGEGGGRCPPPKFFGQKIRGAAPLGPSPGFTTVLPVLKLINNSLRKYKGN